MQVVGSVAQRAVQCLFQSLALELLLGKWLYGMWCLRTCMSREQYYAEKRSAPVGNRLRGLPCLRTLVSPECHSDREVQRAAAIPSSSCKKNDAVPCGMTGSYAAYPEIPVCFPFVGFHRNQPFLRCSCRQVIETIWMTLRILVIIWKNRRMYWNILMRPSLQVIVNGLTQCTSLP